MAYNSLTDFMALIRSVGSSAELERMPGLDYVMAALARAGLFELYVGQTPPTTNQVNTVWLRPSLPSWVAEGTVFLWNSGAAAYQVATPTLWNALLAPATVDYSFQSAKAASATIGAGVSLLAVQRFSPTATALTLPNLGAQFNTGRALKIVDWSTSVTGHAITLSTPDGATIMQLANFELFSTADQLAGITLFAVPELNGWVIAP